MSRLRVFYGEGNASATGLAEPDEPVVFSYTAFARRNQSFCTTDPLQRARALRTNDRCPRCERALVEPVELADALRSRNNLPIPGTATLVGFHCMSCHWEWPA